MKNCRVVAVATGVVTLAGIVTACAALSPRLSRHHEPTASVIVVEALSEEDDQFRRLVDSVLTTFDGVERAVVQN